MRSTCEMKRAPCQLHEWCNDVREQSGENQDEDDGRQPVERPQTHGDPTNDRKDLQHGAGLRCRCRRVLVGRHVIAPLPRGVGSGSQSCNTTLSNELLTVSGWSPSYSMKPSFLNLFKKRFTRERGRSLTVSCLSTSRIVAGVVAVALPMQSGCPAKHPS